VTLDDFWTLVHRSSTASNSQLQRTEWLTGQLAWLPAPPIIEFELHLTAQRSVSIPD
jgi:uncharacterized protein DUF4240